VNFTSHEYVGFVTYSQCVSSIELNACKDEWVVAIEVLQEKKKKQNKATKNKIKIDLVYGQYTNTCKLGAKSDGQEFLNHKSWWQQLLAF
jgi:hypothetical protein